MIKKDEVQVAPHVGKTQGLSLMQNCIVAKKGYKWQKLFTELKHSSTVSRIKWAFGLTKFFRELDNGI